MFTKNVMKSPPVYWNQRVCEAGTAQVVFINSGNANAATGHPGHQDVKSTAEWLAQGLGIDPEFVCLCSTGVIGVRLPMDRIETGVHACIANLAPDGSHDAATAIMTTDTVPKESAVEVDLSLGAVRIGAIAKGSGMTAPNMATMICVLTTDAAVAPEDLRVLLRQAVDKSFHQICIDNDMSTSDSVLLLANGQGIAPKLERGSEDYGKFAGALTELCQQMAKALVKDGEGATKFVEIETEGAESDEDAKTVARTIAHSMLCKTAFFGEDPNWGRLACAAGYSGVQFNPDDLSIWLDDLQIVRGGLAAAYREEDAAAIMKQAEFRVRLAIGHGPGRAVFWTSDLSHEYVSINADYRT